MEQAGPELGERDEPDPLGVGTPRVHGAAHDAEMHRAHHLGLLAGCLEQWATAQPDRGAATVRLRLEPQLVKDVNHPTLDCRSGPRLRSGGGGQVRAPGASGRGSFLAGVLARAGQLHREGCGQPGVLTRPGSGSWHRGIQPRRSSTTGARGTPALGQAGVDQRVEVLAHGVGVLFELPGEGCNGRRVAGVLERDEHAGGRATGRLVDPAGRGGEGAEAGGHASVQSRISHWIIHGK